MYSFTISGDAVGKGRPRFTTKPYPHSYTPKGTERYEELVKASFLSQCRGYHRFDGAVVLQIDVHVGMPKASRKKQAQMLSGEILPTKKPDADNIAKIIMDALNGLAYEDDKQVTDLIVSKHYADTPCVMVRIMSQDEARALEHKGITLEG